jgi:hypothetical protein
MPELEKKYNVSFNEDNRYVIRSVWGSATIQLMRDSIAGAVQQMEEKETTLLYSDLTKLDLLSYPLLLELLTFFAKNSLLDPKYRHALVYDVANIQQEYIDTIDDLTRHLVANQRVLHDHEQAVEWLLKNRDDEATS